MYNEINGKQQSGVLKATISRQLEPSSISAIQNELQNLQLQIKELYDTLATLFNRMTPILLPRAPQEAKLSDLPRLCPLAEELRDLGINVGYMIETVHDVHDALQL